MTLLAIALGRAPWGVASWLGRRMGDLAYLALPHRRRIALENLAQAFPEMTAAERRALCRRSWQHLGLVFVELCALLSRPLDDLLSRIVVEGREHLDRAMAAHGRVLALTGHLGNWEVLSVAHRVTPYPLAVVVRPLDAGWINPLAERLRLRTGIELIDKRKALRPILAALSRGGMVGILLDQNATRSEGVFVPFFGRLASTSRSVALLALRTGAPIVPIFSRREGDGRHRIIVRPPLDVPETGDRETAVAELTGRCTEVIEAAIREAPEQWLWVHNRWRTRPLEVR
ncbi:MAG TPA: lysophospholipid acyltransferase family protein [Methylomirabilota bacterium]|nr:lysophospholipid acyltransferase family protein [Methylomirabilota bacterium]